MYENLPVLVTGASGRTGRRVVGALAKTALQVRAFIRRTEAATEMKALGADQIALGDLFDAASLADAIAGCGQVLHICPPMHPKEAELARTVTDLCQRHGVGRLVLYSVLHPLATEVPHHARKLAAEQYLVASGQPYTILQPARYMQHLVPIWKRVLETGVHDMPFSVEARFSVVDLGDLADAAAIVLIGDGHEGATYQLAGPQALNQRDMAGIISEVVGTPVHARAKGLDEFRKEAAAAGMAAERIEAICTMNRHYDAHGLTGNANILRWLLGREPTDFRTFVERDLEDQ
jgi:uncharacterized protein YbjT (DUF2867 family)